MFHFFDSNVTKTIEMLNAIKGSRNDITSRRCACVALQDRLELRDLLLHGHEICTYEIYCIVRLYFLGLLRSSTLNL